MENEFNCNGLTEFSKPRNEIALINQNYAAQEYSQGQELASVQERATETTTPKPSQDKKQNTAMLAKVLATTMVVASGTVGVAAAAPKVDVRFEMLNATESGVQYSVFVEDLDKPLVLVLQNDFTNREVVLQEGINEGEFTGLASNMQYVLTVYYTEGLRMELAQEKVQTLKYIEFVQSSFERLEYTPAESAQGKFAFTPYYSNPNGEWTEIRATLTDEYGVGFAETLISESGVTHEIPLTDKGFFSSNGYLQVWALNAETQEEKLLYGQDVEISQTQTQLLGVNFKAAGADATAYCTVEYVDENGYWQRAETDEILDVEISALEEGYDGMGGASIYQSGDTLSFIIYRGNYGKAARLLLQIYAYNADGERVCIYEKEYDGVGEDFIPSASDWYEEPIE